MSEQVNLENAPGVHGSLRWRSVASEDARSEARDGYVHDFAILNKSYGKDLRWAVALFCSWDRFARQRCPYFIVVPESELDIFESAFLDELSSGRVSCAPRLVAEEWLLTKAGISVPTGFTGWHVQQLIKLCFSKSDIARTYLTVDSCMLFTKKFDTRSLFVNETIFTSANFVSKQEFFTKLADTGEKGWLDGNIVNLSESLNRICEFMENTTEFTNGYVSCTGMFDSNIAKELEIFACGKGVDGFVGLLTIAPYEFAWYGEFVFSQRRAAFNPHDPHLMTLAHSQNDVDSIESRAFVTHSHHFGVMFQPPAADLCDPDELYRLIIDGHLM